jgi:hypothetical protein
MGGPVAASVSARLRRRLRDPDDIHPMWGDVFVAYQNGVGAKD